MSWHPVKALTPRWLREQIKAAEADREDQRRALAESEILKKRAEEVVSVIGADRRKNHYGPMIARALGKPA